MLINEKSFNQHCNMRSVRASEKSCSTHYVAYMVVLTYIVIALHSSCMVVALYPNVIDEKLLFEKFRLKCAHISLKTIRL